MTRRIVSFLKHLIYSRPGPAIGRQRVCKFAMAGLHFGFLPSQPDKALSHFLPSRPPLTMSMSIHVLALTSHNQPKTLPDMSDALLQSPNRSRSILEGALFLDLVNLPSVQ